MISAMNISFAKLSEEQCETCIIYESYSDRGLNVVKGIEYTLQKLINKVECKVDECKQCNEFDAHKLKANIARERYSKDKEGNNKNSVTMSIDMQKVIVYLYTEKAYINSTVLSQNINSCQHILGNQSHVGKGGSFFINTLCMVLQEYCKDSRYYHLGDAITKVNDILSKDIQGIPNGNEKHLGQVGEGYSSLISHLYFYPNKDYNDFIADFVYTE